MQYGRQLELDVHIRVTIPQSLRSVVFQCECRSGFHAAIGNKVCLGW
jgi:hypothetical protein